ncbi:MAG TPA: galactitol-1-phosphate 5-dehydrogenase [Spirochaetia bacterium]|nr:galactitol-1-phosphate 5-dehydrogenase [Spirochaetia bacterium]
MKALVLVADKKLEYREVPMPVKHGRDPVLVRVTASGICGSDMTRAFHGGAYHYPLVMGHEFAGIVDDPGTASGFRKGDAVAVFPLLPDFDMPQCQIGEYARSTGYDYLGSRRDGGFAEFVYVPEFNLFRIPDHVDIVHAALTEPCAVALHGVSRLDVTPSNTAAVFGGGPVGNMVAQWLRVRGARDVIVVDIDREKLKLAKEMGFSACNPDEGDPVEQIRELTGGGADCVVEAVGLPQTFVQAIQAAGPGGQVVFLGNIHGEFRLGEKDFSSILRKELRISGTWNSKITPRGNDEWSAVLSHLDRDIRVEKLISHTPPLSEGVEVFERMASGAERYGKVIFRINMEKGN